MAPTVAGSSPDANDCSHSTIAIFGSCDSASERAPQALGDSSLCQQLCNLNTVDLTVLTASTHHRRSAELVGIASSTCCSPGTSGSWPRSKPRISSRSRTWPLYIGAHLRQQSPQALGRVGHRQQLLLLPRPQRQQAARPEAQRFRPPGGVRRRLRPRPLQQLRDLAAQPRRRHHPVTENATSHVAVGVQAGIWGLRSSSPATRPPNRISPTSSPRFRGKFQSCGC